MLHGHHNIYFISLILLTITAIVVSFTNSGYLNTDLQLQLDGLFDDLKQQVNEDNFQKRHLKVKRDSGCPGGEGNYGFNSFNFMTFMLLVYNIVTNINNNLNNNNNNANKNNINSINQDSQTVSSSVNAVNQLMVTVLPIPGKRSVDNLVRQYNKNIRSSCSNSPTVSESFSDIALHTLLTLTTEYTLYNKPSHSDTLYTVEDSSNCQSFSVCQAFKTLLQITNIKEAYSRHLHLEGYKRIFYVL